MKTKLGLIAAFMVAMFLAGFAHAKSVVTIRPELNFEVPEEVLKLTDPTVQNLGPELTSRAGVTYADMKEELKNKTKNPFALSVTNMSGRNVLLVANGKPVYYDSKNGPTGLFNMTSPGTAPIPYNWFEKYGDPLVIGMFPLEPGNKITTGYVFAVKFADLIDGQGNLRYTKHVIPTGTPPLSTLRVYHAKPSERQFAAYKVVELKPGVKPLVIAKNPINTGPIVTMDEMKVGPKDAHTTIVTDENGVRTVVPSTVASTDQLATKPAAPSPNSWAKIDPIFGAEGKPVAALVKSVTPGSPYDLAGLRPGMRIVDSRPEPVDWVDDCHAPAPPPADLLLRVVTVTDCGWELETTLRVDGTEIRKALEPQPTTPPDAPVIAQVEQGTAPANTIGADNIVAAADPRQE